MIGADVVFCSPSFNSTLQSFVRDYRITRYSFAGLVPDESPDAEGLVEIKDGTTICVFSRPLEATTPKEDLQVLSSAINTFVWGCGSDLGTRVHQGTTFGIHTARGHFIWDPSLVKTEL
jgi:hypothetical protein